MAKTRILVVAACLVLALSLILAILLVQQLAGTIPTTATSIFTSTTQSATATSQTIATSATVTATTVPSTTATQVITAATSTAGPAPSGYITADQAAVIAIELVGQNAKVLANKSELNENPPCYELEISSNGFRYELKVHAITGRVIEYEKDAEVDK